MSEDTAGRKHAISIPEPSLVVLVGTSGSGKSVFANRHFRATEVISSDACRGMVSDDTNDQSVTKDAFEILRFIAAKRLANGKLVVVDATNVQAGARAPMLALAREYHVFAVAIVLDVDKKVCLERNRERPDRNFGAHVVENQRRDLRRSLRRLKREGFRFTHVLKTPEEIDEATVERTKLWTDRSELTGPFDIIGDVHGCAAELAQLLETLGYQQTSVGAWRHPEGRTLVFLGDIVDRGPDIVTVARWAMASVREEGALWVPGNHDVRLVRKLNGREVKITHGLAESLAAIAALPEDERAEFTQEYAELVDGLVSHALLDERRLVVAHAGMKEELQGRASRTVREFALYGETTGETDELGLPVREDWSAEYRGEALVVYGHSPVSTAEWRSNTLNIDTGCVFGGKLTALRCPERELVHVEAVTMHAEPVRPLADDRSRPADLLRIEDVTGKRVIETRLRPRVTIREEQSAAALEAMSRFAVDPRWLITLPPTMSPCETATEEGYLEYPTEALAYYATRGVTEVVCEEKHMGSRAVVVVCRDEEVARRFGETDGKLGECYTRTGRRFFSDDSTHGELIERARGALTAARFWESEDTDWACLDCEILPWSAKALELVRSQYAPVGTAGVAALEAAETCLAQALGRVIEVDALVDSTARRLEELRAYQESYAPYCWDVDGLTGVRVAPFHVLAGEPGAYTDRPHSWHLAWAERLAAADDLFLMTSHLVVDPSDQADIAKATEWWLETTRSGGEGMVVKPMEFIALDKGRVLQPGVKCRGRDYLRMIYGPEYALEANLSRLRSRNLRRKRSLAIREYALGVEALERFVRREALWRVHECVFGVLALECEPVDARL